jgi:hypothetical protein
MATRYDPKTGHADYPHEPGTLHDCEPCERLMAEQEPPPVFPKLGEGLVIRFLDTKPRPDGTYLVLFAGERRALALRGRAQGTALSFPTCQHASEDEAVACWDSRMNPGENA